MADRTITIRIAVEGGDTVEQQLDRLSETLRRFGDGTAGAAAVDLSPTLGGGDGLAEKLENIREARAESVAASQEVERAVSGTAALVEQQLVTALQDATQAVRDLQSSFGGIEEAGRAFAKANDDGSLLVGTLKAIGTVGVESFEKVVDAGLNTATTFLGNFGGGLLNRVVTQPVVDVVTAGLGLTADALGKLTVGVAKTAIDPFVKLGQIGLPDLDADLDSLKGGLDETGQAARKAGNDLEAGLTGSEARIHDLVASLTEAAQAQRTNQEAAEDAVQRVFEHVDAYGTLQTGVDEATARMAEQAQAATGVGAAADRADAAVRRQAETTRQAVQDTESYAEAMAQIREQMLALETAGPAERTRFRGSNLVSARPGNFPEEMEKLRRAFDFPDEDFAPAKQAIADTDAAVQGLQQTLQDTIVPTGRLAQALAEMRGGAAAFEAIRNAAAAASDELARQDDNRQRATGLDLAGVDAAIQSADRTSEIDATTDSIQNLESLSGKATRAVQGLDGAFTDLASSADAIKTATEGALAPAELRSRALQEAIRDAVQATHDLDEAALAGSTNSDRVTEAYNRQRQALQNIQELSRILGSGIDWQGKVDDRNRLLIESYEKMAGQLQAINAGARFQFETAQNDLTAHALGPWVKDLDKLSSIDFDDTGESLDQMLNSLGEFPQAIDTFKRFFSFLEFDGIEKFGFFGRQIKKLGGDAFDFILGKSDDVEGAMEELRRVTEDLPLGPRQVLGANLGAPAGQDLASVADDAVQAANGLSAFAAVADGAQVALGAVAARTGVFGSALQSLLSGRAFVRGGPIAALAAGFFAVSDAVGRAKDTTEDLERRLRALDLTGRFDPSVLSQASRTLASSTVTGLEDARAGVLAALEFGRDVPVGGLDRFLALARDLAEVLGTDLVPAVQLLGAAYANPSQGAQALNQRIAVLTDSQLDQIRTLDEGGRQMDALNALLQVLDDRFGGAARSAYEMEGGLHALSVEADNLLTTLGELSGIDFGAVLNQAGGYLADQLASARRTIGGATPEEQLAEIESRIAEKAAELDRLFDRGFREPSFLERFTDEVVALENAFNRVLSGDFSLEPRTAVQELQALIAEGQQIKEVIDLGVETRAMIDQAQEERRRSEQASERLGTMLDQLEQDVYELQTDRAQQIADRATEQLKVLEALRAEGADADALSQAEELLKQRTALLVERETASRRTQAADRPSDPPLQRVNLLLEQLASERSLVGLSDRERSIERMLQRAESAVSRGDGGLTAETRAQIEAAAGALFDAQQAARAQEAREDAIRTIEAQIEALGHEREALGLNDRERAVQREVLRAEEVARRAGIALTEQQRTALEQESATLFEASEAHDRRNRLLQEGAFLTESLRDASVVYEDELLRLKELLDEGAISQETFGKAAEQAYDRMLDASTEWQQGVERAFRRYADSAGDAAAQSERFVTSALSGMEDALVRFVTTGEANWRDMVDAMIADFARLVIRTSITAPLAEAAGIGIRSIGSSLGASLFHEGGVAGETAPTRTVPASLFAGAPRLHSGNIPSLLPDEVPSILKRGEIVLSPEQSAAARAGAAPSYVIQVDARGADDPAAVEERVNRAVDLAMARHVPGIVRTSVAASKSAVVDDWRRRGGRFG